MGFIRLKNIKGKHYAYLVRNNWNGESSRQSVLRYLGRVHYFEENKTLFEFDFSSKDFKELCVELAKWQLINYGFKKNAENLENGRIVFSLAELSLKNKRGNDVVIKSHDGFFCEKTIKELINFKARGNEEEAGYHLARLFVETGIDVPKEIFIWAFEKSYGK